MLYQRKFGYFYALVGGELKFVVYEKPNERYADFQIPVVVKIDEDLREESEYGSAGNLSKSWGIMIGQFPIYEFEEDDADEIDIEPENIGLELITQGVVDLIVDKNPLIVSITGDHIWGIQSYWSTTARGEIPKAKLEKIPDGLRLYRAQLVGEYQLN